MVCIRRVNCVAFAALVCLGLVLFSSSVDAKAPDVKGLIDIDYADAADEAKVEINLRGSMLTLLARGIKERNPQGSEFLMSLTAANVRVYEQAALAGRRFDEIRKFYRQQMNSEWETLSRTKDKGITFEIYSLAEGDIVSGLVVLVENEFKKEFAVVNLAGRIDITKLSQLDKITGVNVALPEFDFQKEKLPTDQQKKRKEQRQKATTSFLNGNHYQAITALEGLEAAGMGGSVDYAFMAVLYHAMGAMDKSYYYLGRLYEQQDEKDISIAFYRKAVEVNPESEALKKLSDTQ